MAHAGAALVGAQTVPNLSQGGAPSSLRRDMGVQTDALSLLELPLQWAVLAEEAMQAHLPAILARMRARRLADAAAQAARTPHGACAAAELVIQSASVAAAAVGIGCAPGVPLQFASPAAAAALSHAALPEPLDAPAAPSEHQSDDEVSATAADEASSGGEGAVGGDGGGGGVSTRAATAAPAAAEPLKTRLRWTPELHALFTVAVEAAGGLTNASPNATLSQMRARVAPGTALPPLTVAHLKSHLQKCRLEIQRRAAAAAANAAAAAADAGGGEVERPRKRRRNKPQPLAPAASAVDAAQRLLQLSAAAATQAGPGEAHAT